MALTLYTKVALAFFLLQTIHLQPSSTYGINKAPPLLGNCFRMPSMKDFSTEKFEGLWYMAYQFQHPKYPRCTSFNFTATSSHSMKFQDFQPGKYDLDLEFSGTATSKNFSDPAAMVWTWDMLPSIVEYVTMVETDYETFAILVTCSDYTLFHQKSAFVLSRNQTDLPAAYISRAKSLLERYIYLSIYQKEQLCYNARYSPRNETYVKKLDIDDTLKTVQELLWKIF